MKSVVLTAALTGLLLASGCGRKQPPAPQPAPAQEPETPIGVNKTMVKLETSKGDIVIELNRAKAPLTVANFLQYVKDGHYDGTIFHRVIEGFMIQGGGFTPDLAQKPTHAPVKNEAANGLRNERGTVAMARISDPHSATSQFYINHATNTFLDFAGPDKPGYAVFGRVVQGMQVVDAIANTPTTTRNGMADVPKQDIVINRAIVLSEGRPAGSAD